MIHDQTLLIADEGAGKRGRLSRYALDELEAQR